MTRDEKRAQQPLTTPSGFVAWLVSMVCVLVIYFVLLSAIYETKSLVEHVEQTVEAIYDRDCGQ